MAHYSFDIAYLTNSGVNDYNVFNITNKYPSCQWYASDCGPFGKHYTNKVPKRCNGFDITNVDELKQIINEVKNTDGLFIDFIKIVTTIENPGDDDDDFNYINIYVSNSHYEEMIKEYQNEYNDTIKNLDGINLEIYNLAK
jgi:hypothetical protein